VQLLRGEAGPGPFAGLCEACKEKALIFGDLENPQAKAREMVQSRFTWRRKPELGTHPQVYYLL